MTPLDYLLPRTIVTIEEHIYDHILIQTDGSIETEQAVSHGLGLAEISVFRDERSLQSLE